MGVLNFNFLSTTLGRQTTISVILPSWSLGEKREGYYYNGMKYQTLWLLHGFTGDHEDYIKFSNIVRYAEAHKVAVIMPSAYNMAYTDEAYGAKYMKFVAEELMEVCQAYFPLSTKREDNFIAGLSMGGAGTMKIALAYPEKYSYAYCMSGVAKQITGETKPMTWFSEGYYNGILPGNTAEFIATNQDAFYTAKQNVVADKDLPKFFITVGDEDFTLENCKVANEILQNLGYDCDIEVVPGYGHQWEFWDLALDKALKNYFPVKNKAV